MAHMFRSSRWRLATAASLLGFVPSFVTAQTPQDDALRFRLPAVTVTAQREPEDAQKIPVSVTAVSKDTLAGAAVQIVSDAAILTFGEVGPRVVSFSAGVRF